MPPEPPPKATSTIGQPSWMAPVMPVVPDHELLRRIGGGGYGDVWLARTAVGTWRAVKVVFRDRFTDARPYEREFNGIQKFEPLSRGNEAFIDILQIGRNDAEGYFYYVMELADDAAEPRNEDGELKVEDGTELRSVPSHLQSSILHAASYVPKTLSKVLLQRGRLPVSECLELGLTLNLGLAHLHKAGLIHRDIKPSNIIFVGGVPKLADIGLVIELAEARSFVGTEGFIPPEGPNSPQADLYSLGKVLYEAGMGKDRKDFPEPYTQIAEAPDATELLEFNAILLKACAANREERYQSAEEMNADLALLQSGGSVRRQRKLAGQLRFVQRAGAVVTALAAVVALGWWWQAKQTRLVRELAAQKTQLAEEKAELARQAQASEIAARESLYAADINLAHQALLTDNFRQAHTLLQNHIPKPGATDERGWEWRYLWQHCQSDELSGWPGHLQSATSLAISPDGRMLVTGSYDRSAKVWDLASRALLATLPGHSDTVETVAFSPDGRLVVTGSKSALRLWDAGTFQPVRTLPQFTLKARFSPAGEYLVTGGTNLVLWDTRTWQVVKVTALPEFEARTKRLEGAGFGVAFSPNGRRIGVVLEGGVKFFGVPDLEEQFTLEDRMPHGRFLSFSPDGRTLAACTMGHEIKLWDIEAKKVLATFSGHSGTVDVALFSPDGKTLASCSLDQTVRLWDLSSGALVRTFKGHAEEVWDVAFSSDGKQLASVSKDGAVKLWNPRAASNDSPDLKAFRPLGFDGDGNLVGNTGGAGLTTVDPQTLQIVSIQTLDHVPHARLGNLSSDGRTLALPLTNRAEVEVWDLQRHQSVCRVDRVESRWPVVGFAPGKQLVATATGNQTVTLWQLPQGKPSCVLTNTAFPVAFSPDERMLITCGERGDEFKLWKLEEHGGRLTANLGPRIEGLWEGAFSPDGRLLACSAWGGSVRLFTLPSGQELSSLVGHKRDVSGISFHPDGRTLATISDDGTVRLWHVSTRRELMRFQTPMSDPRSPTLRFSPDGRSLVADTDDRGDRRTYVWHAPALAEIGPGEQRN